MNDATHAPEEAGLKQQLESLYDERARLHAALGTADAGQILLMIDSLKSQLESLYAEKLESGCGTSNAGH